MTSLQDELGSSPPFGASWSFGTVIEGTAIGSIVVATACLTITLAERFWPHFDPRMEPLYQFRWTVGPILLPILFWLMLLGGPRLKRIIQRRGANRLDVLASTIALAAGIAYFSPAGPGLNAFVPFIVAGGLAAVFLLGRAALTSKTTNAPVGALSVFDQVLGKGGLAPLGSFEGDALDRGSLVDAIEELILSPRSISINFGIEGSWGSGKTTLLHELQRRLDARHVQIVWFNAWNYREPSRMLDEYFRRLGDAIDLGGPLDVRSAIRRLSNALTPALEHRFSEAFTRLLDKADPDLDLARKTLQRVLSSRQSPIVVVIDDLDRIDEKELGAILRGIRLVSELPNLTHILAYDHSQISRLLFPQDPSGLLARDYLGKIIGAELPIPPPDRTLAQTMIADSLSPLLGRLRQPDAEAFSREMIQTAGGTLISALKTPREFRRVAAATAWIYSRLWRVVNVFDLFILETIQYRFPDVYATIKGSPFDFAMAEWSSDPELMGPAFMAKMLDDKTAEKSRKDARDKAVAGLGSESTLARNLIELAFPVHSWDSATARRERRIRHPEIFHRYFQLTLPKGEVGEADIEDFVDQIRRAPQGIERRKLVSSRLRTEAGRGRVPSFVLQFARIGFFERELSADATLGADIAVGIAEASDALPWDQEVFPESTRGRAALLIGEAANNIQNLGVRATFLETVIEASSEISFAAFTFRVVSKTAKERKENLAVDRTQAVIIERFKKEFGRPGRRFLDLPLTEFMAIFYSTAIPTALFAETIFRELTENPIRIVRLARLAYPAPSPGDLSENLRRLDASFDLHKAHELTASVPISGFPEGEARQIVEDFRRWAIESGNPGESKDS
jgi:hypothetical protein